MTNENWRGDSKRPKQSRSGPQTRVRQSRGERQPHGDSFMGSAAYKKSGKEHEKNNKSLNPRPKWNAAKLRTDPIPTPVCPYCGLPIKDLASALSGSDGKAVHFECVQKRIAAAEALEKGDTVIYIGGGRFGIVYFENPQIPRSFKVKKIIEWEQKDNRASWRDHIADHFSLT